MKDHLRHSHAVLEKPHDRRNILADLNGLARQNKEFSTNREESDHGSTK